MIRALAKTHLITVALTILVTVMAIPSMAQPLRCQLIFKVAKRNRTWEEIEKFKIMTYNVANIYGLRGKFKRISPTEFIPVYEKPARPKSEEQVMQLRSVMNEIDADIAILTEVESLAALRQLSTELNSSYKSFLIEGNDARGIDIGFMIKADLPVEAEVFSNKHIVWKDPETGRKFPLFSRDLPVMLMRKNNEQKPFAMIFGMHAISQRGRPDDLKGERLRSAQFDMTLKIIDEFRTAFGLDIPVILAGDFNTSVLFAPEMQNIRSTISSAFDLAQKSAPRAARITHTFHEDVPLKDGTFVELSSMDQLDDIRLLGIPNEYVQSAYIYRYKDENGQDRPFATSYEERIQQTSDHLAVVSEILRIAFD